MNISGLAGSLSGNRVVTSREWWEGLDPDEQLCVKQVLESNSVASVLEPLRLHADYPNGLTALKEFKKGLLKGDMNG